jgi:glycosidase/fibronectin type 3 domain-containing protein
VNLAGSLESEATAGACGDWDPGCPASAFSAQGGGVYLFQSATIPAGSWEYKVAMGGWSENYGANFQQDGPNIPLDLTAPQTVRFYYSHATHYIADNVRNTIYTVPGSFNSEVGCSGDWDPACLRTFMSDVDGDGVFTYVTTEVPVGSYEFKIATNESWSNPNYGQGGGPNNVPFTVATAGSTVTIGFDTATNTPSVAVTSAEPSPDGNVEWDGVRHDSRDDLYRSPGGAVPAGTDVKVRLRTFHNDVTAVTARVYSLNANGQRLVPMHVVASDQSCEQAGFESKRCDWWEATLAGDSPDNVWYRFLVTDGTDTDYYADNTSALDGGLGGMSDDPVDQSWALMWHDPSFTAPAWAQDAVVYQVFPDRFRNGRSNNDPKTGDVRYDDPVVSLPWLTLPEGYCRNYADSTPTTCPWRFDSTPPAGAPKEGPRGRDYQGGDLKGIDQQLDYLKTLGVDTLYLNPVFDAGSNHSYDTQDYRRIDPYFGTQKDWDNLVKHARQLGIRIILDGVFNHLSSDSPFFDRYGHYPTLGACESVASEFRTWFTFTNVAPGTGDCAGSAGPLSATYDGWFGFDSIPVLDKTLDEVQEYFVTNEDSITRQWLEAGAGGWRLDVSGDPSFPNGYWETFRQVAKSTKADALLISETWQKDSTLLRMLRGDRLDTTMNYRLRDAVIGFLTPGSFDSKGFADSGRVLSATEAANRLASIREDYPDAAFYSLMNLLDSHDTERVLWTLTPGAETRAAKELDAANLAEGKRRLRLATLLQFAVPGAPTVYYGDEVGVTGDDDPDDRRAFPWADKGGTPDTALRSWYTQLTTVRRDLPALREGDQRILLADDGAGAIAIGRKTGSGAAVVVVNRSSSAQTLTIPVDGYLPDGVSLTRRLATGMGASSAATVAGETLVVTVPAMGGVVLGVEGIDLTPPAVPTGLTSVDGNGDADLTWNPVPGAASYNVYVSFVSGGGYRRVNTAPVTSTSYTLSGLPNGEVRYVVVRALDAAGNESAPSAEDEVVPSLTIGWANLQWPPSINHTISTVNRTDTVYGQVWIDGVTATPGPTPTLRAQAGFGPDGSNPAGNPGWVWVDAVFNVQAGNNDEFKASFLPEAVGEFDYVFRYSTNGGRSWLYADLNGPVPSGSVPANPGTLTVVSSGDTTAPAVPTGLSVTSASPAGIVLDWDDTVGDPSFYGYEVFRSDTTGGPYGLLGLVTDSTFTDTAVAQGATYFYVVVAVDQSFNRSAGSGEVPATAELRTVTLQFNVTVPATTDGTGRSVYIAGFLDRLDGGFPQWDPGGVVLTRVDATNWTITFTGKEGTQLEYKYVLGAWDYVEKDAGCGEIANRQLTLSYGATGTQVVNDLIPNWRNVAPCGN